MPIVSYGVRGSSLSAIVGIIEVGGTIKMLGPWFTWRTSIGYSYRWGNPTSIY